MTRSIEEQFSQLEDPRVEGKQLHGFADILILVICAVTSGAEGWEAIEQFGKAKLQWLRQLAPFAKGSPLTIVLPTSRTWSVPGRTPIGWSWAKRQLRRNPTKSRRPEVA